MPGSSKSAHHGLDSKTRDFPVQVYRNLAVTNVFSGNYNCPIIFEKNEPWKIFFHKAPMYIYRELFPTLKARSKLISLDRMSQTIIAFRIALNKKNGVIIEFELN